MRGSLWFLIDETLGSPDNVGFFGFVVGYRGEFKVTSRTPLSLGNVLEVGMEKLFLHHPIMKRLRGGKIEVCGDCKFVCGDEVEVCAYLRTERKS